MDSHDFEAALRTHDLPRLRRGQILTLQVNLTRRCNLACHHCHVESSPRRTESMTARTTQRLLEVLQRSPTVEVLDLTGGAPEIHEQFREIVVTARTLGRRVIDRCNLTILFEPGQEDTAEFLASQKVNVVASLPCYTQENVEQQRGRKVFANSIAALQQLNALGYARAGTDLELDLVYNPLGASLPPEQSGLEEDYRRELGERFGIEFNRLYTITNMPIRRFADQLNRQGEYEAYLSLLVAHFNPTAVAQLMCRSMISLGYDGQLYDCDFNQMLELGHESAAKSLWDLQRIEELAESAIRTGIHCFGCTAGAGSSCGGALI